MAVDYNTWKKNRQEQNNSEESGSASRPLSHYERWKEWKNSGDTSPSFDFYEKKQAMLSGTRNPEDDAYDTWISDLSSFADKTSADFISRENKYQSSDYLSNYGAAANRSIADFLSQADTYSNYYEENRDLYDTVYGAGTVDSILAAITQGTDYLDDIQAGLKSEYDYWNQFESEDAYNSYLSQQAKYERLSNYDLDAAQAQISSLQEQLKTQSAAANNARMTKQHIDPSAPSYQKIVADADSVIGSYEAMEQQITQLQREYKQAEEIQRQNKYAAYLSNDDFKQYSAMGAAIENPTVEEWGKGNTNIFGWKPFATEEREVKNKVAFGRDNYDLLAMGVQSNSSPEIGYLLYKHMTDDEVATYNYILAKEGAESADAYLSHLEETLNYRQGNEQAANIESIDSGLLRGGAKALYGVGAGLDQWVSGTRQLITAEELPTSATQFGSAAIREGLLNEQGGNTLGSIGYDIVTTSANMAPSILLSYVTAGLGAPAAVAQAVGGITLGASASGNAYNQALKEGYTQTEARNYAALVGASEASLSYVLGGISKLGGIATNHAAQAAVRNIDNALLRIAADTGIKMAGEGFEEYLQEILEPAFRNLCFDENNEIRLFSEEAAYSFLLGALTAGFMEGKTSIADGISVNQLGKMVEKSGKVDALVQNALALDPSSEAYKLAKKIQDGSAHSSSSNIGELLKAYNEAGGNNSFLTETPAEPQESAEPQSDNLREAALEAAAAQEMQAAQAEPVAEQATLPAEHNKPAMDQAAPFIERGETETERAVPPSPIPLADDVAQAPVHNALPDVGISADAEANTAVNPVATTLESIKEAGAVNLPYETVIASTSDIVDAGAITPEQVSEAYQEGLAEYNNNQASNVEASVHGNVISKELKNRNVFKHDGLIYSLENRGNGYYLTSISRDDDVMGGMISNARSNLYQGGPFTSRAEAIADIAGVYDANFADNKSKSVAPSLQAGAVPDTMSSDEQGAIRQYKSGSTSYILNEKLYSDAELSEADKALVNNLDKALDKLPNYEGTTYRVLCFDRQGKDAYDAFIAQHVPNTLVFYGSYISAAKTPDAFDVDGTLKVKIEIEGKTGKDVSQGFGLETEQEILYSRAVNYITKSIGTAQDGTPVIKIKEVSRNDESILPGRKEPVDSAHQGNNVPVREMQAGARPGRTRQGGLRSISERDTAGSDTEQSGSLQRELSGGQRDAGRTEGVKPSEKPHDKLASILADKLISKGVEFNSSLLFEQADKAYGGTMAAGAYTVKDAYDALELAVNKTLLTLARNYNGDVRTAISAEKRLQKLLATLPTQTKRTEEQQSFQQFSTPPNIAYLAAWVANIASSDVVLEPSAGIGGLAVFPKAWGATVIVNELSERRLEFLKSMGFDRVFNENAEQINNVLPDDVTPSVVIMNPPFSSTAGRTATNKTANATRHIEQALARLQDGGRLVAILGRGMSDSSPTFAKWWDGLREKYNIRANIGIDGSNYRKYGTTFDVQLVVIDKTGAQTGETITGTYKNLTEIPSVLEGIRNDRKGIEVGTAASTGGRVNKPISKGNTAGGGTGTVSDGRTERAARNAADNRSAGAAPRAAKRNAGLQGGNTGSIPATVESADRSSVGESASGVSSTVHERPELLDAAQSEPQPVVHKLKPARKKAARSDNGIYAEYVPADLPIKGAKKHPAPLVESAAMAAVTAPKATYKPNLPKALVEGGGLSSAQLENIVYAGQAHQQTLPDGTRKGYFIGDGTGVGKGRQISGIILDNMRQGRNKAVWVSKNLNLLSDAQRDWADIGQSKDDIASQASFKLGTPIGMEKGILFTGYDTLRSSKGTENRIQQIVDWLGKDFDGVIAFDEAHNMGNLLGKKGARGATKGSAKAQAGVELQKMLPNARIVYVSATGATDVNELAYAQRLGLWGRGTAFNDVNDFVSKIGSSGIAAMELVARDMKAMGSYLARSISYDGVTYDTLQHKLTPMQTEIYNTMSGAWQITMQNINAALKITNANLNAQAKSAARSAYYSAMQRFYNQVLTSMSMPSVIEDIKKELAAGHSCVLQIVNTNAAEQERQMAKIKDTGGDLDDMDLTPRGTLIGYLENSFPVYAYEEYTDENGKTRSRIVTDKNGKPVVDREALAMRNKLVSQINEMSIPDGPLEMLFDAFGTDAVAEVTGRGRRVVPKVDERGRTVRVEERRSKAHTEADIQSFQDGKKRILIFSDAGGTGKSYHADVRAKNQQKRIHYLVQPGWSASTATQGFGRSHRSNQATTPQFKLVTTNIMGQKRFVSTIARRLDQLGALTKGQRETGSGMFTEKDNLESALARDSLRLFYENLGKNRIDGVDGLSVLEKLGLSDKFTDEYGNFEIRDENVARDMNTFLNRILALEVDEQNAVFDEFYRIFETQYDTALENGTLDRGMENVKADKIEIVDDKVIRTDTITGATTNYVQAKTYQKPTLLTSIARLESYRNDFQGLYKTDSGEVRAVYRIADKTSASGKVNKMYRMQSPSANKYGTWNEATLSERAQKLDRKEWAEAWKEEVRKAPQYDERTIHMLTGTLLPIWDKLPQEGNTRAMRITADDGAQYLGRVIPADRIDGVLRQLGSEGRTRETFAAKDVIRRIMAGETARLTRDHQSLVRKRVSGEYRIEITGKNLWYLPRNYQGIISEYINYESRYFIPTGEKGEAILTALIKDNPIAEIYSGGNVDFMIEDAATATDGAWSARRVGGAKTAIPISDIIRKMRHDFGIPVGTGRMPRRNVRGQYDRHAYSIKTRITNDLPTVAHELGHHLDNVYGITRELEKDLRTELIDQLGDAAKRNYPASKLKTEGFAEFMRRYMQNKETAKIDYPLFSAHFEAALEPRVKGMVDAFADEINAYYSLDADTAQSSIRNMGDKARDFRTIGERVADKAAESYQAWVDSFHGIKLFDRAAGTNTYMAAINSVYADTMAYSVLTGDLTDTNGKRRGDGLQQALKGINMKDKAEWAAFGEYLIVRHGPERLAEGMRVFADDRKNSTFWMNNRQDVLEQQYPQFKAAAERLYEFQRLFLQVYGVETGLISAETAAEWAERWEYYVPFNRALDKVSRKGARRGFANQNSTIRRARGSGADFINPVDNIINNMVKMVNAGIRNSVMAEVRNAAVSHEGLGSFLEQVPAPTTITRFSTEGLKQQIEDQIMEADLPETETNKVFGIINGIDDFLLQFKRGGKTSDNTVTVLIDGKQEYWRINDPLLLESLTNMSQKEVGKVLEWYGAISRLMTSSITGLNLIWSIGSNSLRDIGSLITYSKDKNLVHIFKGMARAYVNSFKNPDKQDALYKEFLAMGGGSESAYTADKNMTRDVRAKLMGSKAQWINPIQWIEAASNIIERGPRYATYKMMRDRGMTPQEAIYASHDITVNFRRGGSISRQINKAVPFFNAGVQGIDKLARWLSCEDVTTGNRAKAIRTRAGWYVAAYGVFGVLQWLINSRDDEDEKYYAQLSNYTKNNFWCIPVYEDGQHTGEFVTIPKPRELAMPSSLVSAILERFASGNEEAFKEFDDYALGAYLPNVADDAVKGIVGMIRGDASFEDMAADLLGNLGIIGIAAYTVANRDFLGKPIESTYYENLERRDRYNDRTSKLAYLIGQAFNESPIKIDYVGQQVFGGFWKTQKALFPVNPEEADYTLGLGSTYRRDSQYSTDLVNNMYSIRQAAYLAHNSAPEDIDKAIAYKEGNNMTTFYSRYNKLDGSNDTATRQIVLDVIDEFNWSATSGERSNAQKELDALCKKTGSTEYMCAVMQPYIKDDDGKRHDLSAAQYVEFQGLYNSAYWQYVGAALNASHSYGSNEIAVMQARSRAYDEARSIMLSRIGVESEYSAFVFGANEIGLTAEDDILFQAALEAVDRQREAENESLRKEDVYDVLESMDISDEQRAYLFDGLNYSGASNIYSSAEQLNEWIAEKRAAGSKDSSIASSITEVYKTLYIQCWRNGDKDGMNEIARKLTSLDLRKDGRPYYTSATFREWMQDYRKNPKKYAG